MFYSTFSTSMIGFSHKILFPCSFILLSVFLFCHCSVVNAQQTNDHIRILDDEKGIDIDPDTRSEWLFDPADSSVWQQQNNIPLNPWTPPEYFPSKSVIIEWDHNINTWTLYSELIDVCQSSAEVILVVRNTSEENYMRNLLSQDGVALYNVRFVHVPTVRMWIRDHGPLSVNTDNGMAFMDFEDFASSGVSGALPTNLANEWQMDVYNLEDLVLDGGNFMVDSFGNLFATHRIYTNNPHYPKEYIDTLLNDYMGIHNIFTFDQMGEDDYWGHIDMQMKLLDDTTVVISSVEQDHPDHDILENNAQQFAFLTSPKERPYRIRRLPKADNWKTYTNALLLNDKLIMPVYNHPNDQIAMDIYQELLPGHNIVGINANAIVHWNGVIHCITMQLFDDSQIPEQADYHTITTIVQPRNSGSVLGHGEYEDGAQVTLSATPFDGYHFLYWSEDNVEISEDTLLTFQAEHSRTLSAHFSINTYQIDAIAHQQEHGVITGSGFYAHFDEVSLLAEAHEGFGFVYWTEDDQVVHSEPGYSFFATRNRELKAHFTPQTHYSKNILDSVTIFPNPFADHLILSNISAYDRVVIVDPLGHMKKVISVNQSDQLTIETHLMPDSFYFLFLENRNGARIVKRIVKR